MNSSLIETLLAAATEVHRHLGPLLLESIYESALSYELALRGISFERQLPIPVIYKGVSVRTPLFLDLLVEKEVVVEIKSSEKDNPYYQAQLLTHLRLIHAKTGLLINFGKASLQDGICRLVG